MCNSTKDLNLIVSFEALCGRAAANPRLPRQGLTNPDIACPVVRFSAEKKENILLSWGAGRESVICNRMRIIRTFKDVTRVTTTVIVNASESC